MSDTLSMPAQKPAKAKTLDVEILYDVWHPETGERIRTNVPVTDEFGNPEYNLDSNGKPKSIKTTITKCALPAEFAKALMAAGKANRADPLPE
jgi:hypothetical protein